MNPQLLLPNIKAFLARYSLQQKLGMLFSAGLVVAMMWGMVYFVNKVEYQVLYSELDPQEAQSIVTRLQGMQVPYRLSDDGTTIRVASQKISEVRMQLSSEGLPQSGQLGYEIFDRTNFGLTNFQEQVNYQRALEGELARSITTVGEVAAARVHLVLAKDSLYAETENQTKASVILKLKNGRTLRPDAVQGIVNVVASSVKGLSPDKVTVIDFRGKVLSRSESETSLTGQQLDMRQKMENEMAAKIVQILEPAVGAGRVRPQVSIAMNFQQVQEDIEQFDPNGSVIKSQERLQKSAPVGSRTTGGIVTPRGTPPAAETNPPSGQPVPTATDHNEVINYEVSKSVRHIINPVGGVEKLSVAVLIDNKTEVTPPAADGAQPVVKSLPRKSEEMTQFENLVKSAIGFNLERGDLLTVTNISFENESEVVAEPGFMEVQAPTILTGLRYLIVPVVFILIYLLFVRPVQKTVLSNWIPVEAGGPRRGIGRSGGAQTPMTVKQLEARLQNGGDIDDYEGTPERELLPLPQQSRMDLIRKRVVEQTKQDPETVARLVRMWLNEEKNK